MHTGEVNPFSCPVCGFGIKSIIDLLFMPDGPAKKTGT